MNKNKKNRSIFNNSLNSVLIFVGYLIFSLNCHNFTINIPNIPERFEIADINGRIQEKWNDYDPKNWTLKIDKIEYQYKPTSLVQLQYSSEKEIFFVSRNPENKHQNYKNINVGDWFVRVGPNKPLNVILLLTSRLLEPINNTKSLDEIVKALNSEMVRKQVYSGLEDAIMVEMKSFLYMNQYGFLKKHPKQFKSVIFRDFSKMAFMNKLILRKLPNLFLFKIEEPDLVSRISLFKVKLAEVKQKFKDDVKKDTEKILLPFFKIDHGLKKMNSASITVKTRIKRSKSSMNLSNRQSEHQASVNEDRLKENQEAVYKEIEERIDFIDETYGQFESFITTYNLLLLNYSAERFQKAVQSIIHRSEITLFFNKTLLIKPNKLLRQMGFAEQSKIVNKYMENIFSAIFNTTKISKDLELMKTKFLNDIEDLIDDINNALNTKVTYDYFFADSIKSFRENIKKLIGVSSFCADGFDEQIKVKLEKDLEKYLEVYIEEGIKLCPDFTNRQGRLNVFLMNHLYTYLNGPFKSKKCILQKFDIMELEKSTLLS